MQKIVKILSLVHILLVTFGSGASTVSADRAMATPPQAGAASPSVHLIGDARCSPAPHKFPKFSVPSALPAPLPAYVGRLTRPRRMCQQSMSAASTRFDPVSPPLPASSRSAAAALVAAAVRGTRRRRRRTSLLPGPAEGTSTRRSR